ncbi:tyrosine-type recombinase/integrase [Falsiroseomonas sp.]|uniref:tyrosine-type recombinase/integrase n=1 Tax=Falsiroseomonas sp. TaxID=2870721 RepID=UPI00356505A8
MAGKLTVEEVKGLTGIGRRKPEPKPGRHTDGNGLHLHVRPDSRAGWVLRYRLHGRQRDMSLGGYPDVSLAEARDAAEIARQHIKSGRDPIRERQRAAQQAAEAASRDRTFRAAMASAIGAREGAWKNEKHRWQWRATVEKHALPILGDLPVAEVSVEDVLRVLRPIWAKIPETASRLRGRIETILDHARALNWRVGENPARWRGNLAELLPNPSKIARVQRQPALPWNQVPTFMVALRERHGRAATALTFAILTAARTGEVRGMTWGEVDLEERVWTVPAERMKAGEMHRVPLSDAALAVLRAVRPEKVQRDRLVFPNSRGGALSDMALTMLVRGMATDGLSEHELPRWRDATARVVVPHGFRSTFRDWCSDTRHEGREAYERALAHLIRDESEAAYARSDLLERRRGLMQAWGEFCCSAGALVIQLDRQRVKRATNGSPPLLRDRAGELRIIPGTPGTPGTSADVRGSARSRRAAGREHRERPALSDDQAGATPTGQNSTTMPIPETAETA